MNIDGIFLNGPDLARIQPLSDVLALTEEKPLFGHTSGKLAGTHWVAFLKQ